MLAHCIYRSSDQGAIRKAAIFCIAMAAMVIPSSELLADKYHMSDTVEFLQALVDRDTDHEVQEMAMKVLSYLQHALRQCLTANSADR